MRDQAVFRFHGWVDEAGDVIAPDYLVVAPKNRTQEGITGIVVVPFVAEV